MVSPGDAGRLWGGDPRSSPSPTARADELLVDSIQAVRKRKTVEPLRAQLSVDAVGKRPVGRAGYRFKRKSSQIGCSNDFLVEDDDDDDEDRDRQSGVEDPKDFMDEPTHGR